MQFQRCDSNTRCNATLNMEVGLVCNLMEPVAASLSETGCLAGASGATSSLAFGAKLGDEFPPPADTQTHLKCRRENACVYISTHSNENVDGNGFVSTCRQQRENVRHISE